MTTTAAAPSLSGQQLPAVTVPFSRKTGCSCETPSSVTPARGPSSLLTTVPSGSVTGVISRSKNPSAMAFSARFWLVTPHSSWRSREMPRKRGDVLGRLAHGDVDVGEQAVLARVGPGRVVLGGLLAAGLGVGEPRVLVVARGAARTGPVRVLGDALDPGREEDVALAGLDGVEGHPGRLHRGGAEPVDRGAGEVVEAGQDRDDAGHVGAVPARGLGAAPVEVLDERGVELGDLGQGGLDHPRPRGRRAGRP